MQFSRSGVGALPFPEWPVELFRRKQWRLPPLPPPHENRTEHYRDRNQQARKRIPVQCHGVDRGWHVHRVSMLGCGDVRNGWLRMTMLLRSAMARDSLSQGFGERSREVAAAG